MPEKYKVSGDTVRLKFKEGEANSYYWDDPRSGFEEKCDPDDHFEYDIPVELKDMFLETGLFETV